MKKLLFAAAIAVFTVPMVGSLYAQDESIDITGQLRDALGGGGNNNGRGGNRQPQIPDSKLMVADIKDTLKKGKTPLDKDQEKALQSMMDKEVVALSDRIQILRNNNNNNNGDQGGNRGGRGNQQNNQNNTQQPNQTAIQVDTITTLKNDDFIDNKLAMFLTPEQVALVKKAKADDKNNSTCLGGLLDRYYNQIQNPNRGNNNNQNYNNNRGNNNNQNNNNNNNAKRPNGQAYCMTLEATPSDRLEPIRKVLSKGNLPLAKDKDTIAEVFMKSQLQDLEAALRAGLTGNNQGGGRGNNNNNRNNNPQQIIQSATDNMYKKAEAMLNPMQADVLKKWHYEQMLGRGGIETLVAVEAMQDTPLTDEQYAKVSAAWPELRTQIANLAKQAGKSITDKQRDSAAMDKILGMLEPAQEASYRLALKYGPQAAAGK
jgi:hypothetical protein